MENGVSSFNKFVHELSIDSDASPSVYCSSDDEYSDGNIYPPPLSQSSSASRVSSFRRNDLEKDLHLAIEVLIEALFDIVRKMAFSLLSPGVAIRKLWSWFLPLNEGSCDSCDGVTVPADSCESDMTLYHSLNTDARTCQDVITELGYPYEAILVITRDEYILLLERIPRRDTWKAVYLQHGILDSSMGCVSNGIVGSSAFAAYDQGYDVFLGNCRGLVSREHVSKSISSQQCWSYSINEHGTEGIPAMIEKIHHIKTSELTLSQPDMAEETNQEQLYKLCIVCHSLGGATMLCMLLHERSKRCHIDSPG